MKKIFLIYYLVLFNGFIFGQNSVDVKYNQAIFYFKNGDLTNSYKLFKELTLSENYNFENLPNAFYYLGEISFQLDKKYEALLEFDTYLSKFPLHKNNDIAIFRLGELNFSINYFNLSAEYFNKFITEYPDNERLGLAEYWLAESYIRLEDYKNAEFYYLESIRHQATNKEYEHSLFSLAFLYEKQKLYNKAEIYYDRLLFERPESKLTPLTLTRVGVSYYVLGKFNKAINRLTSNELKKLPDKDLEEATYILANCYYRTNKFYQATNEYYKILNTNYNPDLQRPIKYGLAWSLYQENNLTKAHSIMSELKNGKDSLAERATYWAGYFSRYLGNNEQAINEFKEYLDEYPIYRYADDAKYQIGLVYYLDRRYKEAEKYLFAAYDITSEEEIRAKASLLLGNIELNRKNFPKAKIYFEAAVSGHKEDAKDFTTALLSLGIVNFYLNNYETAKNIFSNILTRTQIYEPDKVYFYLAESHFSLKNFSQSANYYETVIKSSSSDSLKKLSKYGLIYSNFNVKNYNYVITLINDYIKNYKNDKHNTDLKLRLADCYYALKDYDSASEIYKEFFNTKGLGRGSDYAAYQYAQALYKSGNINAALEEFKQFSERFPSSKYLDEVQYVLAWIYFQIKDYDVSISQYQKLLDNYPSSPLIPLVYYGMGDAYFNKSDYTSAINNYNVILTNFKNTDFVLDAINGIQYSYLAQGKISEAAQTISNFINQNPGIKNADKLFIKKGDIFLSQRDFGNAILSYKEFIATFPQSSLVPLAYYSIAKASVQSKNYDEALHNLAIIYNSYSSSELYDDAILESGNIHRINKNYNEATKMYDRIIGFKNSSLIPEATYWKGKCFQEQNDKEKALEYYNIVVNNYQASPFFSRAIYELGILFYEQKNYAKANEYLKLVVEQRNDEYGAEAQYIIGKVLFDQQKYSEAITEFLRLKYAFAGYSEWLIKGLFSVAESYEIIKDNSKAREYYREVSKLDPKGELGINAKKRISKLK